jgi:hypothetical protein
VSGTLPVFSKTAAKPGSSTTVSDRLRIVNRMRKLVPCTNCSKAGIGGTDGAPGWLPATAVQLTIEAATSARFSVGELSITNHLPSVFPGALPGNPVYSGYRLSAFPVVSPRPRNTEDLEFHPPPDLMAADAFTLA